MALGRQVDIAINHDPDAILMHKTNHPKTLHLTEDIFRVDLKKYVKGKRVALMWASPDCTSHSKAKGGKPREKGLRILPWAVYKHAKAILPDVIIMENVEEIQQWGPLDENGHPIKERRGEDYKKFITAMKSLGYIFDCRELIAADYGAPTTRKRWYAVFRRDGKEIRWPKQTHSKNGVGGYAPWEPIWKYLDLQDFGKSIFGRKKPLAKNTMNRIARGLEKFVFYNPEPFMVQVNHGGDCFRGQSLHDPLPTITQKHGFGVVTPVIAPFIEKSYGGNYKGAGSQVDEPLHTITTVDHNHLVTPYLMPFNSVLNKGSDSPYGFAMSYLTKFYKSGTGQSMLEPIHTITTSPGHFGLISAFLIKYYGTGGGQELSNPLATITTKDRFGLVNVILDIKGEKYVLKDIFLRMLKPEELKLMQGFPEDYIIDRDYKYRRYPIAKQVARIGNSVVPIMAQKLVEANCPYLKIGNRVPNIEIYEDEQQIRFA